MKAKVDELVKGKKTRQEKIESIFKFVSQEIRYMGITTELESPGYEPHEVADKKVSGTLIESFLSGFLPAAETVYHARDEQTADLHSAHHLRRRGYFRRLRTNEPAKHDEVGCGLNDGTGHEVVGGHEPPDADCRVGVHER